MSKSRNIALGLKCVPHSSEVSGLFSDDIIYDILILTCFGQPQTLTITELDNKLGAY